MSHDLDLHADQCFSANLCFAVLAEAIKPCCVCCAAETTQVSAMLQMAAHMAKIEAIDRRQTAAPLLKLRTSILVEHLEDQLQSAS